MTGFVDRTWASHDGLALYARDYAGAAGPAKAPVICIHGLTRNSRDFEDVAPWIAAQGRRVLAIDVRGRGRSARDPQPMNYHPGIYAADVMALLDQAGIARAVFVGTSMGGLITMVLASLRPEAIAAAALNDVGPELSPVGLARIAAYAGQQAAPVADWTEAAAYAKRTNGAAFPNNTDADWDRFARRTFDENASGRPMLAYDPDIAVPLKAADPKAPPPDMGPLFRALTKDRPTLLVRGGLSDLIDAPIAARMREAAPDMLYAEVPNVGHAPMLDEPEAREGLSALLATAP